MLVYSFHPDQGLRTEEVDAMNALGRRARVLAPFGLLRVMLPVPAGSPDSRGSLLRLQEKRLLATTRSIRAMGSESTRLRDP